MTYLSSAKSLGDALDFATFNRTFSSCHELHFESEAKRKAFHMKISFENDVFNQYMTQAYSEKKFECSYWELNLRPSDY